MTQGRLGFCCNWLSPTRDEAAEGLFNPRTTTITSLGKLSDLQVTSKLINLVTHNLAAIERMVTYVGSLPEEQRMFRLGSDLLPAYTHEVANWAYKEPELRALMENGFAKIGAIARQQDIRLSFHPGQYCVLNSVNESTYYRAITEFEYHVEMMRLMGYTTGWHPHGASINIHVGSRAGGIAGLIRGLDGLSDDARNLITIENDEYSFGLDELEYLAEHTAIVFDIHHEWIKSEGQYVQPDDPRLQYVKDSWRGVRPLGHFSTSRPEALVNPDPNVLPDFNAQRLAKTALRDLRAHSDYCWNKASNAWAISHLSWMDIEVEAKMKNLASSQLNQQRKER
jgi:UV DNA damage repair endonuclease